MVVFRRLFLFSVALLSKSLWSLDTRPVSPLDDSEAVVLDADDLAVFKARGFERRSNTALNKKMLNMLVNYKNKTCLMCPTTFIGNDTREIFRHYGINSFVGSDVDRDTLRPDHIEKLQEIKADGRFEIVFKKQLEYAENLKKCRKKYSLLKRKERAARKKIAGAAAVAVRSSNKRQKLNSTVSSEDSAAVASVASKQSTAKNMLPAMLPALNNKMSKCLCLELCNKNSMKCKLCGQKLHPQTLGVLSHYKFRSLVLGKKLPANEHFSILSKVVAKPEYADTVAHFATRIRKEVLVKKSKKLKE